MMAKNSLPREEMLQAASRLVEGDITVLHLGVFVSTAEFLTDQLAELQDLVDHDLADHLETLEEVYAVALERHWVTLPPDEKSLVRDAVVEAGDASSSELLSAAAWDVTSTLDPVFVTDVINWFFEIE